MATIPQVAQAMHTVLTSTAAAAARQTGLVQRQSKLTGPLLVQTLVFGWLSNPQATLEELCQTAAALGVDIRPQGLDQRFTPAAAACLRQVLAAAVSQLVAADPVALPLLQRFNGVYVQDSSTLALPAALAEVWPGCGGNTPQAALAALKLQVRLDLTTGVLTGPHLQAGREHDATAPLQTAPLPVGALRLADLGYFSLEVLANLDEGGAYWLSRLHTHTAVWDAQGKRWEVLALLEAQLSPEVDLPIGLGVAAHLPARLLAVRVPQEVADQRRRRLRAQARRRGKTVSAARLALAGWTVLITNVPVAKLTLREALVLARARWQIELVFKLWKDQGKVDEWRSHKPWRILSEVYAKLVAMVIQHWVLLVRCWAYPDRSLHKAAQTLRRYGLALASVFGCIEPLCAMIATIQRCLAAGCRINKRKTAPHTFQLLLAPPQNALA